LLVLFCKYFAAFTDVYLLEKNGESCGQIVETTSKEGEEEKKRMVASIFPVDDDLLVCQVALNQKLETAGLYELANKVI